VGTNRTAARRSIVLSALLSTLVVVVSAVTASAQTSDLPPGGTFSDDDGSVHEGMIEAIVAAGITQGCTEDGGSYCPATPVTRGQMATFLTRALDLPPADGDYFPDDDGSAHEDSINRIAAAAITSGRPDGTFGADDLVTREQMATFLATALDLPPAPDDRFTDVSGVHEDNVARVAAAEVTVGCDPDGTLFCPSDHVTRAQMATFLGRALDLTETIPPPRPEPETTIAECLEPRTSAENVARCFGAAVAAGDDDAVADVADARVIERLQEIQHGDVPIDFGSFHICGAPLLGDPSTGVSCQFYDEPVGTELHGVTTELLMGQRDGQYFVEGIEFIG
jgi:hypothetical protein